MQMAMPIVRKDTDKYRRTWHLPWTHTATKDDKIMDADAVESMCGVPLVVSEKLDGSNLCLAYGLRNVFARSHAGPPTHHSFSPAKSLHGGMWWKIPQGIAVFGEWVYQTHSIRYTRLHERLAQHLPKEPYGRQFFHIFGIQEGNAWWSWGDTEYLAKNLGFVTVPVLWRGTVQTPEELRTITESFMGKPSVYGLEREGVVVRLSEAFTEYKGEPSKELWGRVAKCVRENHVRTPNHWRSIPPHQAIYNE